MLASAKPFALRFNDTFKDDSNAHAKTGHVQAAKPILPN